MSQPDAVEYLSFGAGAPSLALAILNAWGQVSPRAQLVVFADTGWEKRRTLELLPQYEAWLGEHDLDVVTVQAKAGPLDDHLRQTSIPIPVRFPNGLGKRQCTDKWKIEPIEQYLHGRYGRDVPLIAQLGLTYDEIHRMKPPEVKRNKNRWPLIEKRLGRDQCVEIIQMAGLPVPPYSACLGCPLQPVASWRRMAAEWPADFADAVEMDELLRARALEDYGDPVYLHSRMIPLRNAASTTQIPMLVGDDLDAEGQCESGFCFS